MSQGNNGQSCAGQFEEPEFALVFGLNLAAGLTFCLTMIAVTTIVFLALRWSFAFAGLTITGSPALPGDGDNANRDTLKRMANAGMDMSAVHAIDFE